MAGLSVTSAPRTWFDLAGMCGHHDLVAITDAILHEGMSTFDELQAAIRPGHRGAARARLSIAAADGRSESAGETRLRLHLHAEDILVVPQVNILNDFGAAANKSPAQVGRHQRPATA
ncbi:hypothetical protein [Fodinicola acaciae]|uniref:hypothetical protein n=1 Tax=Fodinicola acaciae TaxID=2681555 RepID=UPI0013D060CF|nr:hypothetical protein [Fodinicola acaciae]